MFLCQVLYLSLSQVSSHAPESSSTPPASAHTPQLRFDDHAAIFSDRSTPELLRALLVFRLCGIPAFVNNSEALLEFGHRTIGARATNFIIKHTFFAHFCAGETRCMDMDKGKHHHMHAC